MPIRRKIEICKIGEIEPGRTKNFQFGASKGIAYNDKGVLKAYVNRCTHMGGPVELTKDGSYLRCRWHGADFDPCSGCAVEGQAPAGTFLEPIELAEEGGRILAVLELPDDPFSF